MVNFILVSFSIEKSNNTYSRNSIRFCTIPNYDYLPTYLLLLLQNPQNKLNKLIISISGDRFIPETFENAYKVLMKLTIVSVDISDLGLLYKCVAKNSIGDTDGAIKLYRKFIFKI